MNKDKLLTAGGFDPRKTDYAIPHEMSERLRELGIENPTSHFCFSYEEAGAFGRLLPFSEVMWMIFDHIKQSNDEIAQQLGQEEYTPRHRALIDFLTSADKMSRLPVDYNLLIQAFEAGAAGCSPPASIPTHPLDESRTTDPQNDPAGSR